MTEADRVRIAALFAADADFEIGVGRPPQIHAHLHQHAHALDVQRFERVVVKDPGFCVERQKLVFGVFSRERIGRLRQVIGTKGEKLGQFRQITGTGAGANGFDHRAEFEAQADAVMVFHLGAHLVDAGADALELLYGNHLRHHDLRADRDAGLEACSLGLQNGPNLHFVDFRVGDAQSHTAMTEHGVDLMQVAHLPQHQFLFGDDAVDVVFVDRSIPALRVAQRIHGGQRGSPALDHQAIFLKSFDLVE